MQNTAQKNNYLSADFYKLCPQCGNFSHINEKHTFCLVCGEKLIDECPECGKKIDEKAGVFIHCGVPTSNYQQTTNQSDTDMRMLLPVGQSKYAIAAGYLGLFSVLGIFAPFALLFGILAVMDIKKDKDKHGMGRAVFGIVMGIIFLIVYSIYFIPGFIN